VTHIVKTCINVELLIFRDARVVKILTRSENIVVLFTKKIHS